MTAIVNWLRYERPSILDDEDLAHLDQAADRIEDLESLVAADEWTLRRVLDDLDAGKTYDAINSIEIALASRGENGSTGGSA